MIQTFRELFGAIWREQNRAWSHNNGRNKPSNSAKDAHAQMRGSFANLMGEDTLFDRLPSHDKRASDFGKQYLLLPPMEKASRFVSLMWMRCNFTDVQVDVSIRVTMICQDGTKFHRLPFRLESGAGIHNFYHAQLGNKDDVPPELSWIPTSQPSFPLCANCPVTLVIALLLTLYGLKETARILALYKPHRINHYKTQLERWVKV